MASFESDTVISTGRLIKVISACFIVLFITVVPAEARRSADGSIELTIYPAKAGDVEQKYRLMVKAEDQTDADAVPLYEKAIQSIPKDFRLKQIQEWLKLPAEQLPQQQAEAVLQKYMESLKLVARAARCKECNWPELKPGETPPDPSGYRNLNYVIRLWARLETARGGYDGALLAMQTGFGMASHLGQAPISLQVQVAAAVGEVICREVEQFIQGKDSPNLYWAMANLPRPLVGMEKAIENDLENLKDYNFLVRRQSEKILKPAHDRMRMIERRANTHLNALQSLEAIRHYAATHNGQLPEKLSDISQMEVPKDVMSDKPFEYRRTATGAMLQSTVPKNGEERDAIQYEIVLKK
ncbi:MAG TPA: hypothetical protein VMX36_07030 [Sedimentisphaerales bacterium]|nr:hypothetical protein [Sedimentisphaerales bacterium]